MWVFAIPGDNQDINDVIVKLKMTSKPANNSNYLCKLLSKVLRIKPLLSLPWIHFHQSSHLLSLLQNLV
jgi:hypothetical protein